MKRFRVVTNGAVGTYDVYGRSEESVREKALAYERLTLALRKCGLRTPPKEALAQITEEDTANFKVRHIYELPKASPRDFRQPKKKYGKYQQPTWRFGNQGL